MAGDSDPAMADVGARIKAARLRAPKCTQRELAMKLGVTAGAVGNWERGGGIDRSHLAAIARLRGVSLDWLMTGKGDPDGQSAERAPVIAENIEKVMALVFELLGIPADQSLILASVVLEVASTLPPPAQTPDARDPARIAIASALRFLDRK